MSSKMLLPMLMMGMIVLLIVVLDDARELEKNVVDAVVVDAEELETMEWGDFDEVGISEYFVSDYEGFEPMSDDEKPERMWNDCVVSMNSENGRAEYQDLKIEDESDTESMTEDDKAKNIYLRQVQRQFRIPKSRSIAHSS